MLAEHDRAALTGDISNNEAPVIPPGYKQTEVGVIPLDWTTARLGRICSMKSGVGITSAGINEFSKYPCFGGNGLRGFTDRFTHSGRFALIGRQGALCGNVVSAEGEFFASEHAIVVTASSRTDIGWLTYVLDKMHLNEYSESSAQPGLSVSKILLLQVACPPLPEQRAIAEALSDVDKLLGLLEKLIAKKRAIKQAAMQQLLTGKTRLPGFSPSGTGGCIHEQSIPIGYKHTEAGVIPSEWQAMRVGALFGVEAGGDLDPARSSNVQSDSYPYPIYANSLSQKGLYGFCNYAESQSGSITVTARGTLGKSFYRDTPFTAIGRLLILEPKVSMDARFFSEYINYGVHFAIESTGVPQLTAPQVARYLLPVPPEPEQRAIAAVLSDMDAEIAALGQRWDKTRAIRQGMMQQLLTGWVRLVSA